VIGYLTREDAQSLKRVNCSALAQFCAKPNSRLREAYNASQVINRSPPVASKNVISTERTRLARAPMAFERVRASG